MQRGGFLFGHAPVTSLWRTVPGKNSRRCNSCPSSTKSTRLQRSSPVSPNAGLFVVNYNGLTVKQAQELRHQLRECGAEMKVYKNNLVKIALKNQEQPELDEILAGPVAYVFYETEPVEAAKALKDFSAKSKGVLEIKGGISDGKAVSADDVKAIAELPTKDQLLGQIAGLISGFARDIAVCVNGVSSGLARSIQQVSEQKAA